MPDDDFTRIIPNSRCRGFGNLRYCRNTGLADDGHTLEGNKTTQLQRWQHGIEIT